MKLRLFVLPFLLSLTFAACGSDGDDVAADGAGSDGAGSDGAGSDGAGSDGGTDTGVPADDAPLGGGTGAIGTVEITVTHPDIEPIVYTIGCMGDTFPVTPAVDGVNGQQACDLLADAAIRSRLIDGIPADQMCTEIYGGPDEAHIVGQIDGEEVDATITRVNGCEIDAWESMVGLLPPAIGA